MAYRNIEGFEHGVGPTTTAVPGWNDTSGTAGGTPTVQTSNVRTGTYSLRCNQSSAGACWAGWTVSQNDLSGSVYVYIPTLPSAQRCLIWATSTTNSVTCQIVITSNNKIGTKIGADAVEEKAGQFQAGTWHRIDYKFVFNSTTYTIDVTFDGVAQTQDTSGGRSSTTSANFRLGSPNSSEAFDRYYDDFVLMTAGSTFPHTSNPYHVTKMVPSSDGTHSASMPANTLEKNGGTDFTSSSTDAWDWMNAIPADDTTYVQAAATAATHYLEVNFANDADGRPILGACGFMCGASSGTAANDIECRMSDDSFSTFDTIWNGDWSEGTGAIIIRYLILSNAITPGASTVLDALKARWGFSGDASPLPRCSLLITQYVAEDPQPLTGALYQNTPTFNAGKVNMALGTASLFQKSPTFNAGTVAFGGLTLTGTLFQKAPTFNAGKVNMNVAGVLFQRAPTFFIGKFTLQIRGNPLLEEIAFFGASGATVTTTYALTGALFTKAGTFNAGTVTPGARNLSGALFQKSPTFNAGSVAQALTGTLFQKAPTFRTGAITVGAVNLSGTLFQKAPTFFGGAETNVRTLTGVLFTKAPTFFTGAGTATRNLSGALFQRAPTFNAGSITAVRNLSGVLFTKAPTFNAGAVTATRTLTGALFQKAPTFFGHVIQSGTGLVGFLFQKAPVFNAGAVINQPKGALFQKAPTFFTGTVTPGPRNLSGALFLKAPTFRTGTLLSVYALTGQTFTKAPVFNAGAVTSVRNLGGALFVKSGTFHGGAVTTVRNLDGQLFLVSFTFPQGLAANQGNLIGDQVLLEVPLFFSGLIARFDYTPEWRVTQGEEWPVTAGTSWPVTSGTEWRMPPED